MTPKNESYLSTLPFVEIGAGCGAGLPMPPSWKSIRATPLLVFVGVTGVGKSTTLDRLLRGRRATMLPDRRLLTDKLMIATMQRADGVAVQTVTDRTQRFAYTRRFREQHPGGMADALALLALAPAQVEKLLIFDGLRGANEIEAACAALPLAHFVMLDAPDAVRVVRLLGRGDPFDRVERILPDTTGTPFHALGLDDAAVLFSHDEQAMLLGLVDSGRVSAAELRAKVKIVVEERRSYDPQATRNALATHAGERALWIDTATHAPDVVARKIVTSLGAWGFL
jgi:hypothetical protein